MDIFIAAGGMPFGPTTADVKSLGGSETAAIQLAERLAEQGADVTLFCQLPPPNEPDHAESGSQHNGVRYLHLDQFQNFACSTPHDLLIAQRNPQFVSLNTQSKKKVLWVHDIATYRGMRDAIEGVQFAIDEIWTVSEWHRQQIHEVTDYPLDRIVALRNAVVCFEEEFYEELELIEREPREFFYAARPERGLVALVRPGGIMSRLPDCNLKVSMYAHFPENMHEFYNQVFGWIDDLPNVEYLGSLSQKDMRRQLKKSVAYVYPTAFEETSCIIARECIETLTPFLSTGVGALTETMGDSGIFYEDWTTCPEDWFPDYADDEFCEDFAQFILASLDKNHPNTNVETTFAAVNEMALRKDIYWDGVAQMVLDNAPPRDAPLFSRAWSLLQDGDVIPAEALLAEVPMAEHNEHSLALLDSIHDCYPFVFGNVTMEEHYNFLYEDGNNKEELVFTTEFNNHARINEVRDALKSLEKGSTAFEYGCGAGHMVAPLAIEFPDINFVCMDIAQECINVINEGAKERELTNLRAVRGDQDNPVEDIVGQADFVWCSEVLEHTVKPWEMMEEVEGYAKKGGHVLFTVPYGPWDPMTFKRKGQWKFRAHIWEISKPMIVAMLDGKEEHSIASAYGGSAIDGRAFGNYIFSYKVDHNGIDPIDAVDKAMTHFSRQSCAAAVIAYNNADTIEKMLDSIDDKVQHVQIAMGPSTDNTKAIIEEWFDSHKYMTHKIVDVPKISPPKEYGGVNEEGFGFDDARSASVEGLEAFDWILWIDTDEYLVGNYSPMLRDNALDSYLITQHHFTVEPRGEPAQLDRPARLIRTRSNFKVRGHIHEHFEIPEGGPGRGFLLPNVDIGHVGYENEETRKLRFARNFPFLQWDHEEGTERKLHTFLWFRDIVHRVRYLIMQDKQKEAFDLANEGLEYYNENWQKMASFGPGTFQALEYMAELNKYLDRGLGVNLTLALEDGKTLQFNTKLDDFEQLDRVLKEVLGPEYERRASRYF